MTAAATTAAADTTVTASLRIFRRRARRVTTSKVPGGGGRGWTCWSSQLSRGSRWSLSGIGRPPLALRQRLLQLRPGMVQVGLDSALRPLEQRRDLLDPEPGVVVQQERVAQPGRQPLEKLPDVDVLRRLGERLSFRVRGHGAHRAAFSL